MALVLVALCQTVTAADKPNVVVILVDDLGWSDLACQGSKVYQTPNIDRMAESGMRFTDAYASCPVCSPTRASIMTGKYPARLNITDWIPGRDPKNCKLLGPKDLDALPLTETTIAESMKTNGYKTFFAGKWHLGGKGFLPDQQGFDINLGGYHMGSPQGGYYSPYRNPKLKDGPKGEYLTDRLTNESIEFMRKNKANPFFLYLSFYTVHEPVRACKRYIQANQDRISAMKFEGPVSKKEWKATTKLRQDSAEYASMVQVMDENVGRLLKEIEALKLKDKTIVIFTSDNGGLSTTMKRRRNPTSNMPLRAGKGWCYEGGIRVPLIVVAPGVKSGTVCGVPVTSTDLFPTILDFAKLPAMPQQHMDGVSLMPVLAGKVELERDAIYWHFPHYHGTGMTPGAAVRAGKWKLIEYNDRDRVELYDLENDIGEQTDLSGKNPEETKRLLKMLHDWQKDVGAKMATPNPRWRGR